MGGKCWHSSPQGRMKPVTLFVALLLIGLATGEDDEERKGAGVKGACKNTGPKPSDKLFAKYTIPIKNKKCPCWWDMSKKICACCKGSNSMQCGWPMHRYCYKKSKMGCPGVCNNKYTLSGKGFPCYNDKSKGNTCAWCADWKTVRIIEDDSILGQFSQVGSGAPRVVPGNIVNANIICEDDQDIWLIGTAVVLDQ